MKKLGLDPTNPVDNVTYAKMLYDSQGWKPWACVTLGYIAMR